MQAIDFKKLNMDRDAVIREYAHLVKIIAYRLAVRLPSHIDINDLINAGIIGLIDSIDAFDPARGVKMETYLSFRIKGSMLDELRSMDWLPRSVREKSKQLERGYAELESKLGRTPTDEEMAESFGMDEDNFQELLRKVSCAGVINLEDMGLNKNGDDVNIMECLADPRCEDPVKSLHMEDVRSRLAKAVDELPEKERLAVSLYYYEELNLKEIGHVMSLTESRVCQLHTQAIHRLKGKLKKLVNMGDLI
ncbi:MAG: FliA/WhiG family RNA polymerase sigma factor [Deltaproteobacteria bacterium]|nr:FliA/WhiG family RNA polymerase sigma factor [Deltaproteobacteria bacterium]